MDQNNATSMNVQTGDLSPFEQNSSADSAITTQSLTARIYVQILNRLLSGEMTPGQLFNRRQIAVELGVSVAPVLEAMVQLQAEGLIETLPRKGTRVPQPTRRDVRGQLIVRQALESQAARIICGAAIGRHYKPLHRMALRIDEAATTSIENWREEVRFHHRLVQLAGVPTLSGAHDWIMKVGLFFAINVILPAEPDTPRDSHVQYLDSLLAATPDRADAIARAHIQCGKEALFQTEAAAESEVVSMPAWL